MKKVLVFALMILLLGSVLCLASCSADLAPDGEPIPDDMKIASNTAVVDYLLFVPEDWIIDLQTWTTMAHASVGDLTTVQVTGRDWSTDLDSWWADYKAEIEGLGEVQHITQNEKTVVDGIAAKKSVYRITVGEMTYKCMIIGVVRNGKVYEILYNSVENTENEGSGLYTVNMETFESILESFRFTDRLYPADKEEVVDENAPEGMKLASNVDIVDYSLYVPKSWIIDIQTGSTMAHVSDTDKSSIQVGQWNLTENIKSYDTWWTDYKRELALVGTATVISEPTVDTVGGVEGRTAEYTLKVGTSTYKCRVSCVIAKGSAYVILYTSTESGYDANIDDVNKIIKSFKFN